MYDLADAKWWKSSRSNANGSCVEVATNLVEEQGVVGVRDSKDPAGPALGIVPSAFAAFVTAVKVGDFDQ